MCLNYVFHLSVYSFVIKSQITLSDVILQMNAVSSLLFSLPGPCQLSLHQQCVVLEVQLICTPRCAVHPDTVYQQKYLSLTLCIAGLFVSTTVCTCHLHSGGPLPHSVDVSLGLCFNSGSALFQFIGSLPVLCKKQGLNHSHPNFTAMFPIHHCPLYPLLPGSFPYGPESNMGDTATRQH